MTRKMRTAVWLLAGGLFVSAPAMAGDMEAQILSNTCAGCHGVDGASQGQAPVIGGLSEEYLKQAMLNYQSGKRPSTIMDRIAKGYTAEQIAAMAKHYAAKPWVSGEHKVDAKLVEQGKKLHTSKGCAGCHGATGVSPVAANSRLAGQYPDYLEITLKYCKDPALPIPAAAMPMRAMLGGLSNEDLSALAHFYASQK